MLRTILLFTILGSFLFTSCGNSTSSDSASDDSEMTEDSSMEMEGSEDMKYTLTPFSDSPAFEDATLSDMVYQDKQFNFTVSGDEYELGRQTEDAPQKMCANSAKGQHIHLIVDNQPYSAQYESSFEYEIEDGTRYILAFLSRSYHESIKTDDAHIVKKAKISDNSLRGMADVKDAILFYSRPKGTYVGEDTKKVMLDFYLTNTSISENGNKVKADINGEVHTIDTWQPYYIEGLPMGENTITLTLVDENDELIKTPLNPVTRKFTLVEDPAPAE